jgi:hypothetical protein
MIPEYAKSWQGNGARAATRANNPGRFIDEHISPLFFRRTNGGPTVLDCKYIVSEEQFWSEGIGLVNSFRFGAVRLNGFSLTDWFPRAPGVYWSRYARNARESVYSERANTDADLGMYFSPESKMGLIEDGGMGTIRLRPRRIDGEDCWLATALTGIECHCGIPLAIPDTVLREAGVRWGDQANIQGRVRFLQDAGLDATASAVHHARPLIVFVDELEGVALRRSRGPIVISPVALFESTDSESRHGYDRAQYTFVKCAAGDDSELDAAVDWIEKYATKYAGRVITNFDEQRPVLADAPLSYQRLVAKTYDRAVIERFTGTIHVARIDRLVQESVTTRYYGDIHLGHKIKVGGSAIINIDSALSNVTQTIGTAPGLDSAQKSQLEALVQSLKADLAKLKASHADETKEITEALEKAVANAAKPPLERKQSLLQLSANGLKEAAELVKDVAPSILTTAGLIAKFVVGL